MYESNSFIKGNTISNNYCYCAAGGISCFSSNPTLLDNVISDNNSRGAGAGFLCHQSQPVIVGNQFTGNVSSTDEGGAVGSYNSSMIFERNYVAYNISGFRGGGILNKYSDSYINNNIFAYNQCAGEGGAIFCSRTWSWSNPTIINNVIYGNQAGVNGGAIKIVYADPIIFNTIMWNNSPDEVNQDEISNPVITYSNIQGGWQGEGNIDTDPLFRNVTVNDFHLMSTDCGDPYDSPCIDTGNPIFRDSLLDCSWGLGDLRSDMGAYGGGDSVAVNVYSGNSLLPAEFMLLQNYPNPFNAITTIEFILEKSRDVNLTVYNLLGQKIRTITEGKLRSGVHRFDFDASSLSSGAYFYMLRAGDKIETKRMALLK
jgi:hypothetical protein